MRSAARPELGIDSLGRSPGAGPAVGQRRADDLAEHLADFRGGGEIARGSERVARRIIMRVAQVHVTLDADRSLPADLGEQVVAKARQATLSAPKVGSTRTRRLGAVTIK